MSYAACLTTFVIATKWTTAANAIFLQYSGVVWVLLASPLLARFQEVHRRLTGKDAEVLAIHAGLECGILREKLPGMDAISFGPIITGAHSPDEGVKIDSVGRFWELLKAVLAELAGG